MTDVRPQPTITSVDGVPLVWAEAPEPCTGALLFRAGRADETLPTNGVTHLVEHLALHPFGRQAYQYNGSVEENITMLYASGKREEVVGFLAQCAQNLTMLPLERLADEKRVLGIEAAASGGLYSQLLSYRYGARGYGLTAFNELGLRWLQAEHVTSWAARLFTRGNSVAWLSGPPDGLSLPLPDGPRRPAPEPEPLDRLDLPTQTWHRDSAVAFDGQRSAALNAGFAIAADRVHQQLRLEEGVTYSPGGAYHHLTAERVHLMLSTDCAERNAARVRERLLAILDELGDTGPEQSELEWNHSMLLRQFTDPRAVLAQLDAAARRELIGGEPVDDATLVRNHEALTPQAIAAAISEVMDTMLLSVPHGTPKSARAEILDYAVDLTAPTDGTRFGPREKWKSLAVLDELIVGAEAISFRPRPTDDALTIAFEECVAAVEGQGSSLTLVSGTGTSLRISPDRYEEGQLALDTIRRRLPAEIVVPMDESGQKVAAVAEQKLSAERQSPLVDDLESLVALVARDERVLTIAEARRARFKGLLATTDRRLLFIFNGDSETDFRDVPLEATSGVGVKGLRKKRLCLTAEGEDLEFSEIWPRERLDEIHGQLTAAA